MIRSRLDLPRRDQRVFKDILVDIPEDSELVGGAGVEELNSTELEGNDVVILLAFSHGMEVNGNAGLGRGQWGINGVGEGVMEDLVGA